MFRTVTQRLITVFFVAAFALTQGGVGSLIVRCEDAWGQATLEFACDKTSDRSCRTACDPDPLASVPDAASPCDDEEGEHRPHPCKDTPLGKPASAARLAAQSGLPDHARIVAVVVPMAPQIAWAEAFTPACGGCAPVRSRPPDTVARLRTIIMNV